MRTFKVDMVLVIDEADYDDLQIDTNGWDLESEIRSWLPDLGFGIMRLNVDEERN